MKVIFRILPVVVGVIGLFSTLIAVDGYAKGTFDEKFNFLLDDFNHGSALNESELSGAFGGKCYYGPRFVGVISSENPDGTFLLAAEIAGKKYAHLIVFESYLPDFYLNADNYMRRKEDAFKMLNRAIEANQISPVYEIENGLAVDTNYESAPKQRFEFRKSPKGGILAIDRMRDPDYPENEVAYICYWFKKFE